MADGGALTREDRALIRAAFVERAKLKREVTELSDTKLAKKFGVPRSMITKERENLPRKRRRACLRADSGNARILELLRVGPATGAEVSVALGVPVRNVVAQLSDLVERGLVRSRPFHTLDNPTHNTVKLYMLPGHAA